jgi:muramoyltetrapeptide carboxypeptidase LdcA involved in peptidoglycan recycling
MVQQLMLSETCAGAKAIVLGNFLNCRDGVGTALKKMPTARSAERMIAHPKPQELAPIRAKMNEAKLIPEIFAQLAKKAAIPLYYSLPVGHGPDKAPLPLGATYRLGANGSFELLDWNWLL